MPENLTESLATHLNNFHAAPYAFVGSGLARRFRGLPTWADLLGRFASDIGKDFSYYYSKAGADLASAARFLAEDFHEAWFAEKRYEDSRTKWAGRVRTVADPLKVEISAYLTSAPVPDLSDELRKEYELFSSVTVDAFITTNWDPLLETAFASFKVFRSQDELLFSPIAGVAEIYKIHGCASLPPSLVLTDADYHDFNQRYAYLAAKLLTVFVEHPVVFLGYSFSDANIQALIKSIALCLRADNIQKLQDRLLFVEWDPKATTGAMVNSQVMADKVPVPIRVVRTASFVPVFEAMGTVRRKLPARILRRLKEQVYELVQRNDPKDSLYVVDIDEQTDESKVEVVYGVGLKAALNGIGYRGLQRSDIVDDVAFEDKGYDSKEVLEIALPQLLKGRTLLPVFKYLRGAGRIQGDVVDTTGLDGRVARAAIAKLEDFCSAGYRGRRVEINASYASIATVVTKEGVDRAVHLIALLDRAKINLEALLEFIRQNYAYFQTRGGGHESNMKRLVCLYDFLRYGPGCDAVVKGATSAAACASPATPKT